MNNYMIIDLNDKNVAWTVINKKGTILSKERIVKRNNKTSVKKEILADVKEYNAKPCSCGGLTELNLDYAICSVYSQDREYIKHCIENGMYSKSDHTITLNYKDCYLELTGDITVYQKDTALENVKQQAILLAHLLKNHPDEIDWEDWGYGEYQTLAQKMIDETLIKC